MHMHDYTYNVRLVQNPDSPEISLAVRPGTIGAEIVVRAAQAAMDQEEDRGVLDIVTKREVRGAVGRLRKAGREAFATHNRTPSEVMLRGEAAAAVVEGLGALSMRAEQSHANIEAFPTDAREPFLPALSDDAGVAQGADAVLGELLDQAHSLALSQRQPQQPLGDITNR